MKKIIFSAIVLFFAFGLSADVYAACCVSSCTEPTNGVCADGSSPSSSDCEDIASCSSNSSSDTTTFVNPLGFTSVADLFNAILNNLMGVIAIIAVIFIVIGGIMYMMSGGNEAMVTRAKKTWTGAVIGLAIALAAPTFLKEIQSILGGSGTGGSAEEWVDSALTIKQIAVNVLNLLLSLVGIFGIIAMVIGGGMYFTAYGDERKIDNAKSIIKYAIIGIVVALASLVIIRQVDKLLNADSATETTSNVIIEQKIV